MRIGINGRFLTRRTTGVDRFARELVHELDRLVSPGEAVLAVPGGAELVELPELENIEVVPVGKRAGHAWEQLNYSAWLSRESRIGLSLCNTAPVRNPGVVCIHDMAVRANPSNYSRGFVLWYRLLYNMLVRRADAVFTVSEFSKGEIGKYYPAARRKVIVVPNAWQHIGRVEADTSFFDKHPEVRPGEYYFAMSSLAPNKNLRWLVETARLNLGETVVIAGGLNSKVFADGGIPEAENVVYPGYVSDGEAKALMECCKGFLFPTFYEGFGIPPLEALACGAPVAVSDTEVMHEVYGNGAVYVDPHEPCEDLAGLFSKESFSLAEDVLGRYSWEESAKRLLALLDPTRASVANRGNGIQK